MIQSRLFFLVSLLGLASSAAAAVHPGASCRAVGSSQNGIEYDDRGRIFNNTAQNLRVICPLARQNVKDGWTQLNAVVADRHGSQDIHCEAFSAQTDGLGWSIARNSSGTNPEWYQSQTLSFGAIPAKDVREGGTYYLLCTLPPMEGGLKSGILSYTLTEKCKTASGYTSSDMIGFEPSTRHAHSVTTVDCP